MYDLNKEIFKFYFNLIIGSLLDKIDCYNYEKNNNTKKNKFSETKPSSNTNTYSPKFFLIKTFLILRTSKLYNKIYSNRISIRVLNFFRKSIVIFAYFQILKEIKKKNVLIVFDCSISPPSFGDFFYVVMFARFFQILGKNVNFVIISGQYRSNWPRFKSKKEILNHIKFMKKIIKLYLNSNKLNVKEVDWNQFSKKYISNKNDFLIPFKNRVLARNRIYFHTHNFLYFSYKYNKEIFSRLLLSKKNYSKIKIKKINEPYICFHSSRPEKKSSSKDIHYKEFVLIIKKLKEIYKNYKIVVVSEKSGCRNFKKISKKNKLDCMFSKDICSDLISDLKLIMYSKAYYQYKGGGIGNPILYSDHPSTAMWYEQNQKEYLANEILPQKNFVKGYPWLNKNQFAPIIVGVDKFVKFIEDNPII